MDGEGGGSDGRNPSDGSATLVEKIFAIKKCYDKDELLEALELTREALETANHPSSAILHRLYAKYLKELEVPASNSDHRKLIVGHAKKAVSLSPTSVEYRYFYASLLYEDIWVPNEVVMEECRLALDHAGVEEDPDWSFFFKDDGDGDGDDGDKVNKNKVEKLIDGVNGLMAKVKQREERKRKRSKEEPAAKDEQDIRSS